MARSLIAGRLARTLSSLLLISVMPARHRTIDIIPVEEVLTLDRLRILRPASPDDGNKISCILLETPRRD